MLDRRTFLSLTLATASALLCGCGAGDADDAKDADAGDAGATQLANPFVDCDSAYAAAQLAGFEVTFPESVPGYSERAYQAVEGELAQCLYSEGDAQVLIRKMVDDGSGDVSGDYATYAETRSVTVGDLAVTERGEGGLVYVVVWTREGHAFAIDANQGLDASVAEGLVAATW